MAGVDGDRDGSDSGQGLLELVLVLAGHVHVAGVSGTDVLGLEVALLLCGQVGVGRLRVQTVVILHTKEYSRGFVEILFPWKIFA